MPRIASDGIHDTDVTDDSTRTGCRRLRLGGAGLRQLDRRRLEALDAPEGELHLVGLGVLLGVDDDDLPGAELLVEELLGQLVLDEALDGPAQRAGAEGGVVALVGDERLGRRRELDADALPGELLLACGR